MMTKIAKKSNIGAYETIRHHHFGARGGGGGGVNHSSREVGGSWKIELEFGSCTQVRNHL